MTEKQDDFEQLRYLQEMYGREYQTLLNEISNYLMLSSSFDRNKEILDNSGKFNDSSLLLNIEGGMFVRVNAKELKVVLVQVGAGYFVEKSVEDAKAFIVKSGEKLESNLKQLNAQRQKVEKELLDLNYRIDTMQQS